ncbi:MULTISPECIES: O-antigen ligase family protein [unclassified Pseudomonas]|uniref:O-antigen ligase family protein n=1 Tax=unclassified Pseudomonas TaxID=196821 RepID=UPI000A9FF15F|nr:MULTISPECIES: O-antigen ligase family protein [unclassified Pseudomonas]
MRKIRTSILKSYISIILLLSLFIGYGFFSDTKKILIPLGILFLGAAFISNTNKPNIYATLKSRELISFTCTTTLFIELVIGQLLWERNSNSLLLVAPLAILFSYKLIDPSQFKKILYYTTIVIVILAAYEHLTSSYLYIKSIEVGDESFELSQEMFSGASNLFRAKSIFLGPLTFSAYLICTAIILRENKIALAFCLVGALLSSSRSAIIITILLSALTMLQKSPRKLIINAAIVTSVSTIALFVLIKIYPPYIDRLLEALDFSGGSATNSYRQMFWVAALKELQAYDIRQLILGNNGAFRATYKNNAESGWLTLALDFGVLGLAAYILPLIERIYFLKSNIDKLSLTLLLIANSVFTLCYGVTGCFMYWITLWSFQGDRHT